MQKNCHIVHSIVRIMETNAIIDYDLIGCCETLDQAKAILQYEYDLYMNERADMEDPEDRPVWSNDEHTGLVIPATEYCGAVTELYIDSSLKYHDKSEHVLKYE